MRSRHVLGLVAVALAVAGWGFVGVLVKLTDLDGLTVALYRAWLGSVPFLAAHLLARRPLRLAVLRRAALPGLLFGLNTPMFFAAVKLTSVANATLIGALQPALVLFVAGPMFGERVGAREVLGTVVAMAGAALAVLGGSASPVWSPLGDALAFCALLTWTAFWLLSKRVREDVATVEYMTWVMLVSAVVVTPLVLLWKGLRVPAREDWLWLGLLVAGPGTMGQLLVGWAHRYVSAWTSSLLILAVPVVAAVAGLLVLHEPLGLVQALGGLVLLGAMATVVRPSPARLPVSEPETVLP